MVTLTELKNRKQVKASRIDFNFIEDAEKIANFENQVKAENLQIINKRQNGNHMEYELLKSGEKVNKFAYASWHETDAQKDEFLQDIINQIDLPIIKSYRDENFVYIVTDGEKIFFDVILNNPDKHRIMDGLLVFRSNDYYFQYTDSNNNVKKIFGDVIKASQIQDNKIIVKLGDKVNIEYVMEL